MLQRKKPEHGADKTKGRWRYIQWLTDYRAIVDAPTIDRPQGEWMPVKDRLPEVSKMVYEGSEWMQPISFADYFLLSDWVLVTADADSSDGDDTEIFVARYEDDLEGRTYWITVGARLLNNVTAWMPLPKPWKGAENEE